MLIDSHCHLDFPDFEAELPEVVARAIETGVSGFLTISTKLAKFDKVRAVAERFERVVCSVGVHPHEAEAEADVTTQDLLDLAADDRVVAIGETGLDFYYEHSPREEQEHLFREHIAASRQTGLPCIIHTRDAEEDTLRILREEMGEGAFPALIHCFTASSGFADAVLDLGLYISVSGIVTFKKAEELRSVARRVPGDRLLVETDAPYLAPVPHRGRRNEPAFVRDTAAALAELRGVSLESLAERTTQNFFTLFPKAQKTLAEFTR